jgi:predicted nuclease of predicted toxin-antitoxin system
MRFLVDAQLPPALARRLAAQGHVAEHVSDHKLEGASDTAIWNFALGASAVTISKDEDFALEVRTGRGRLLAASSARRRRRAQRWGQGRRQRQRG